MPLPTIQTVSLQNKFFPHKFHLCFLKFPSRMWHLEVHRLVSHFHIFRSRDVAFAVEEIKINDGFKFFHSLEEIPQLKFLAILCYELCEFMESSELFHITNLRHQLRYVFYSNCNSSNSKTVFGREIAVSLVVKGEL